MCWLSRDEERSVLSLGSAFLITCLDKQYGIASLVGESGGSLDPFEGHLSWSKIRSQIGLQLCLLLLKAQKLPLKVQHPCLWSMSCAEEFGGQLELFQHLLPCYSSEQRTKQLKSLLRQTKTIQMLCKPRIIPSFEMLPEVCALKSALVDSPKFISLRFN